MKKLIVVLALAAAVAIVAAVALVSSGRSSSTAARTGFPGKMPPAAPAGQMTLYGQIKTLKHVGGRFQMRFDPAWFAEGLTARAAGGAGENYVVEGGHRLLTYIVAPDAKITVLTTPGPARTTIKLTELVRIVNGGPHRKLFEPLRSGVWIRVHVDTIRGIDQQYQP